MILLKPYTKFTVWGGERLKSFYGADQQVDKIGSLYTVAALKEYSTEIEYADGFEAVAGTSLYDFFMNHKEFFGFKGEFPYLIAFVDAKENLSIQIHPDDDYARERGYANGKSESWIFLAPPDEGVIYNGSKTRDFASFSEKAVTSAFPEVIDTLPVAQNDYVFIEAGTVHALTAGSFVYEIQQPTDVTYRFYDYERRDAKGKVRPLQQKDALAVVDLAKKSRSIPITGEAELEQSCYTIFVKELRSYVNNSSMTQVLTIVSDNCSIADKKIHYGQSILVMPQEKIMFDQETKVIGAKI